MRTWSSIAAGFVAAIVIGELALSAMAPAMPSPSLWPTAEMELKSAQLRSLDVEPELVIIGSSTSQAAIDPELLSEATGLRWPYNAALPFSTPASNQVWLEEVVLENTSPSLVIVGVVPWATHDDSTLLRAVMHEAASSRNSWPEEMSTMIRSRGVLADWDRLSARDLLLASGLWTSLGHFTGYYDRRLSNPDEWSPPSRAPLLDPVDEKALKGMVDTAMSKGARTVLLVEPACCHDGEGEGNERYLGWLQSRAEAWDVELWDTYSEAWSADLFADSAHLNRRGTELYTKHVAQLITNQVMEVSSDSH